MSKLPTVMSHLGWATCQGAQKQAQGGVNLYHTHTKGRPAQQATGQPGFLIHCVQEKAAGDGTRLKGKKKVATVTSHLLIPQEAELHP